MTSLKPWSSAAFVSVSLDPALAGFFCTTDSYSWKQLRRGYVLGVNVLGADQVDVSNSCMRDPDERFDGLDWALVGGAPRFDGVSAWMSLTLDRVIPVGDHDLALCSVTSMAMPDEPLEPVVFWGGRYRTLTAENGT